MCVTPRLPTFLRRESNPHWGDWALTEASSHPLLPCARAPATLASWFLSHAKLAHLCTLALLIGVQLPHIHDVLKLVIQVQLKCQLLRKDFHHHPNAIFSLCQLNPFHLLYRLFAVWNFLAHALVYLFFSVYNSYNISFRRAEILFGHY